MIEGVKNVQYVILDAGVDKFTRWGARQARKDFNQPELPVSLTRICPRKTERWKFREEIRKTIETVAEELPGISSVGVDDLTVPDKLHLNTDEVASQAQKYFNRLSNTPP